MLVYFGVYPSQYPKYSSKLFLPLSLPLLDFFFASIFSLIVFLPKIKKASFNRKYQKPLFIAGLFGVTLYFIFENTGLKFTDASEGALIVGSFPALGLLTEYILQKEKLPLNRILGVLLSISGVFLIMSDSGLNLKFNNLFGDFLILLSGVSWVIYNWEIKKVNQKYPYEILTTFQMIWGSILFLPFLMFTGLKNSKNLGCINWHILSLLFLLRTWISFLQLWFKNSIGKPSDEHFEPNSTFRSHMGSNLSKRNFNPYKNSWGNINHFRGKFIFFKIKKGLPM